MKSLTLAFTALIGVVAAQYSGDVVQFWYAVLFTLYLYELHTKLLLTGPSLSQQELSHLLLSQRFLSETRFTARSLHRCLCSNCYSRSRRRFPERVKIRPTTRRFLCSPRYSYQGLLRSVPENRYLFEGNRRQHQAFCNRFWSCKENRRGRCRKGREG